MLENVSKTPFKKQDVQTVQNFLNITVQIVQKVKFSPTFFKRLWGQGAKPLSHSAECETSFI